MRIGQMKITIRKRAKEVKSKIQKSNRMARYRRLKYVIFLKIPALAFLTYPTSET